MRSWPRKIQGREFQAEGRVSTEPKRQRKLGGRRLASGAGLGSKGVGFS